MAKKMIQCPRDTRIMYERTVCEHIFRKGNIRPWCKTCEVFQKMERLAEPQSQAA